MYIKENIYKIYSICLRGRGHIHVTTESTISENLFFAQNSFYKSINIPLLVNHFI